MILVQSGAGESYDKAAALVQTVHPKATIDHFDPEKLDDLLPVLKKHSPRHVCVVLPRETVELEFVRRFFVMSTQLDDDPFADFAYGFVTAGDGAKTLEFARRIAGLWKRKTVNKVLAIQGCVADTSDVSTWEVDKGVDETYLVVGGNDPRKKDHLKLMEGKDLIRLTDHGYVWGMGEGFRTGDLTEARLDLGGAVIVSSICYSGVVSSLVELDKLGDPRRVPVNRDESFALAVIHSGAGAYFAGVDGMHGLYSTRMYHAVLLDGLTLGDAFKELQDRMVLEMAARKFSPARLTDMRNNVVDESLNCIANGVLYGDPSFRLYPARRQRQVSKTPDKDAPARLHVSIEVRVPESDQWVRSRYRSVGNTWGQECRFTLDWPANETVKSITLRDSNVEPLKRSTPFWALEDRDGKRFLHACAVYECDDGPVMEQVAREGYQLDLDVEHAPR